MQHDGSPHRAGTRSTNLQVLRAVAASLVVLIHCATEVRIATLQEGYLAAINVKFGFFGVALFFAISGYLMAQLIEAAAPARFLLHRIVRIYPIFVIVVGSYIALGHVFGLEVRRDWLAMSLVPAGERRYSLGVEWTLLYEVTFYVILFLIALAGLRDRLRTIAALWLCLIAIVSLLGSSAANTTPFPRLHFVPVSDITGAFVAGLLVPSAIRRSLLSVALCVAALAGAALILIADPPRTNWLLVIAAPLLVAGAVQIRQVDTGNLLGSVAVRLGDWSYALYLVHMPAIMLALKLLPRDHPGLLFLAGVLISLLAASAFGSLDVALYRQLRGFVEAMSPQRQRLLAAAFASLFVATGATLGVAIEREEREDVRIRAAVASVAAGRGTLEERIAAAGRRAPLTLLGAIDKIDLLPGRPVEVRGWAFDASAPRATIRLVLVCGGRIVASERPRRFRPDIAERYARQDLRGIRIGYSLGLPPACDDPLVPIFVDPARRMLVVEAPEPR